MCLKGLVLGAQPPRYPRRHHLQLLQASAQRLGDKGVPERGRGADGGGELIVFHGLPWAGAPEAACIPALREPCSRWLESRPLEP